MSDDPYISIGEAAKIIGVNPQTLRSWEEQGKLKFDKLPSGHRRIRKSVIMQLQETMQSH